MPSTKDTQPPGEQHPPAHPGHHPHHQQRASVLRAPVEVDVPVQRSHARDVGAAGPAARPPRHPPAGAEVVRLPSGEHPPAPLVTKEASGGGGVGAAPSNGHSFNAPSPYDTAPRGAGIFASQAGALLGAFRSRWGSSRLSGLDATHSRHPSDFATLEPIPQTEHAQRVYATTNIGRFIQHYEGKPAGAEFGAMELKPDRFNGQRPNPQQSRFLRRDILVWISVVLNVIAAIYYLYWRIAGGTISNIQNGMFDYDVEDDFTYANCPSDNPTSIDDCTVIPKDSQLPPQFGDQWVLDDDGPIWVVIYAWIFFGCEAALILGIFIGHTQRLFVVQREVVCMDDLALVDNNVSYNSRVAVLLPTAGEKPDVVLKALLGCLSQRGWGQAQKRAYQRIIVLDEKRRKGVLVLTAAVYKLMELVHKNQDLQRILQFEGVISMNAIDVFKWWKEGGGNARKYLHDNQKLYVICAIMELMDDIAQHENGGKGQWGAISAPNTSTKHLYEGEVDKVIRELVMADTSIAAGHCSIFESVPDLPTTIYYTRKNPGTPIASPKAGNMNAAIFAMDYPGMPPLIGDCTVVTVNDCRHQPQPEFLQRTMPYFFELHRPSNSYIWAKVAFVQTPQRFPLQKEKDDPLGNHAAMQYDVINHGKDGIGAVSSSGHGSLWRVAALRGMDVNGKQYANPDDVKQVGHKLGFRSEMLIEDTHTSIEMFRAGWRSVYVNEPGEMLSVCTHQPDSVAWRIKQVLRWHQGAVQLLWYKGLTYTTFNPFAKFPTVWHRIYALDQATYYLQAFPGYMLLIMPVVYGVTGQAPFSATIFDFFVRFIPFIVTAVLPTIILATRPGVNSDRLARDEQVWLSTTYIQMYAFLSMTWQTFWGSKAGNAWTVKAPTWPLFMAFYGEFLAIFCGLGWLIYFNFESARIQNEGNDAAERLTVDQNNELLRLEALPKTLRGDAFEAANQNGDLVTTRDEIIANLIGYPSVDFFINFLAILVGAGMAIHALWPMVAMQQKFSVPSLYQTKLVLYLVVGGAIILVSGVAYFQAVAYGTVNSSLGGIGI